MGFRAGSVKRNVDDIHDVPIDRLGKGGSPLRVLVYAMNAAPEIAGVGKYTGEIAQHLADIGADVRLVTTPPHYPGWAVQKGYRNRYSSAVERGVRILRAPLVLRRKMRGVWRLFAPMSFAITSMPVVAWQILRYRPDVVFCVEPTLFAAPVAQSLARLVGARTVLHVQDLEVDAAFAVGHLGGRPWLRRMAHAFEHAVLRRFDNVVTISNRMAERLVAKGVDSNRVAVVRNWVDDSHIFPMDRTSPYRQEQAFAVGDFVILYSGNIGAKQGLAVLLEAAFRLRHDERMQFVIAGEGPSKSELQARYGSLPNVRFLPFQPYARLNEFLNMADLHVLPQERGAADLVLPSKLGGMLASGRQVLVTAEKGTELADFLGDIAHLIEPGDPQAMAAAIERCRMARGKPMASRHAALQLLSREQGLADIVAVIGNLPLAHAL